MHTPRGRGSRALLVLDLGTREGEWSASRPGRNLPPRKGNPSTHWVGTWVDLKAVLDTTARGKIGLLSLCRGSNPGRPVCSHYEIGLYGGLSRTRQRTSGFKTSRHFLARNVANTLSRKTGYHNVSNLCDFVCPYSSYNVLKERNNRTQNRMSWSNG
jgi:hypothetical protein